MKSFFLLTLGCPKNYVDSETLSIALMDAGYRAEMKPERADLLLVNTCGFLQAALDEAEETIGKLGAIKKPKQRLIVFGCAVKRSLPLFSNPELGVDERYDTWEETAKALAPEGVLAGVRVNTGVPYAYVKIADGCDEHCAFCAIPGIKGAFVSKPSDLILSEIGHLLEQGVQEIILIAQNTTAYGLDFRKRQEKVAVDSLDLLIELICSAFPELPWLRIMYAYPDYITPRLIEVMARFAPVCHYLDIPLQHASPKVLKSMGRPYNIEKTKATLAALRLAMPDLAIRTTFIVGYPGELEPDFVLLKKFVHDIGFDSMGVFQYSKEPGTPAADLPRQISDEVKLRRYDELMGLQQTVSYERNKAMIGQTIRVLVEAEIEDKDGFRFIGRSQRSAPDIDGVVYLQGEAEIGSFVNVHISSADEYDLTGTIVG